MTDRRLRGHIERRKGDRRKQQLPFEGPERRSGRDRRRFVRRVMSGQEPLPAEDERDLR